MLYGLDLPLCSGEEAVAWAEALSARWGAPLVAMARSGGRLKISNKSKAEALIQKHGGLELRGADMPEVPAYANFALIVDRKDNSLVVYADAALAGTPQDLLASIAEVMGIAFGRAYAGYCFQREYQRGPHGYAIGLSVNPKPGDALDELNLQRWNWARAFGQWRGYLRDVYSVNVLGTELCREMRIDGQTLPAWIDAGPGRGNLEQSNGVSLWHVDATQRVPVREALVAAGLVIAAHLHGTQSQRPRARLQ